MGVRGGCNGRLKKSAQGEPSCSVVHSKPYSGDRSREEAMWRGMWHVWRRKEMDTGCWCGNLNSRNRLKDLNADGRTFEWNLENKPGGHRLE